MPMGGQNHHGSSLFDDGSGLIDGASNNLLDMNTGTLAATADPVMWPVMIAEVPPPGVPENGAVVPAFAAGTSAQSIVTDAFPPNTVPLTAPTIGQSVLVTSGNLTIDK